MTACNYNIIIYDIIIISLNYSALYTVLHTDESDWSTSQLIH